MLLRRCVCHTWRATTAPQRGIQVGGVWTKSLRISCRYIALTNDGDTYRGNFFAFFDIPKKPEVDVAALQKRYHVLQSRVHPDQTAAAAASSPASEANQGRDSTDVSVYANAAYETLRDPFRRCQYLAKILLAQECKGEEALTPQEEETLVLEDDERSMRQRGKASSDLLDEEFMVELMAMNELIFTADLEDESARARLEVLRYDLKERDADYYDKAKKLWEAKDTEGFKRLVQEWTYINNALGHLKQRL